MLYSPMRPCDRILVCVHAGTRNVWSFGDFDGSVREYRCAVLFERVTYVSKHGHPGPLVQLLLDSHLVLPAEASIALVCTLNNRPYNRNSLSRARANGLDPFHCCENLARIKLFQNCPANVQMSKSHGLYHSECLIRKAAGVVLYGLPSRTCKILDAFLSASLIEILFLFHFGAVSQTFHET